MGGACPRAWAPAPPRWWPTSRRCPTSAAWRRCGCGPAWRWWPMGCSTRAGPMVRGSWAQGRRWCVGGADPDTGEGVDGPKHPSDVAQPRSVQVCTVSGRECACDREVASRLFVPKASLHAKDRGGSECAPPHTPFFFGTVFFEAQFFVHCTSFLRWVSNFVSVPAARSGGGCCPLLRPALPLPGGLPPPKHAAARAGQGGAAPHGWDCTSPVMALQVPPSCPAGPPAPPRLGGACPVVLCGRHSG